MSSQDVAIDGSFWAASFVHAANGHDYLAVGHVMKIPSDASGTINSTVVRTSLLDVTDPTYYVGHAEVSDNIDIYADSGRFEAVYEGFGMTSTNDSDPLDTMHFYSSKGGVNYDLGFAFSSPALMNNGLGAFWFGGDWGYQWSMPKGRTSGWIDVNGTRLEIDPTKSSTWWDRQWGSAAQDFQWMMMILPGSGSNGSDLILSVWDWKDPVGGDKSFATMREEGQESVVLPVSVWTSPNDTWTSPVNGVVYAQAWIVTLPDGSEFSVNSVRKDQVPHTAGGGFGTAFSGFANVEAKLSGRGVREGYGLVDILHPVPN